MSSLTSFALKSPNRIFEWYCGKWFENCSNSSLKLSFESSRFSSVGACTFRKWYYTSNLRTVYYILSLINCTILTADTILWRTNNPVRNWWFFFPFFIEKKYNPLLLQCPLCPTSPTVHPLNLIYYHYLAGCPMFPHLPAPISQSCDLSPPILSISPIFFL